jgi:hypothetical protein
MDRIFSLLSSILLIVGGCLVFWTAPAPNEKRMSYNKLLAWFGVVVGSIWLIKTIYALAQ